MKKSKKILISPLNWGLGHASRIVPVIRGLIELGHDVKIGGSGNSIDYLKAYFDDSMFLLINSPLIRYGKKQAIGPGFAFSFYGFIKGILRDRRALKKLCKKYNFDVVISDNRPGLYSKKILSIYITHQYNVLTRKPKSLSGRLVRFAHHKMLLRFDYCLIPDTHGALSLAGILSRAEQNNKNLFVGVLSRFAELKFISEPTDANKTDVLILFSGPEPQRSQFEQIILNKFEFTDNRVAIVRGVVNGIPVANEFSNNIQVYNNPTDIVLFQLIKTASLIICRSGYSSLMDLAACQRKAVLVPTPGQPEQEYLAKLFESKFGFVVCEQNRITELQLENVKLDDSWDYPYDIDKLKNVLDLCLK
ncbi:MAG: glycosyltransferase [Bacteroidales bacterium]|nr:glycosyltransferase [Bacteroidales bacterium]MDD4216572.1 glycosyltransferase [Bacteroidales bacterium]MDY0141351.1 glycosyltransferase [Bacteroidales bacterium]